MLSCICFYLQIILIQRLIELVCNRDSSIGTCCELPLDPYSAIVSPRRVYAQPNELPLKSN